MTATSVSFLVGKPDRYCLDDNLINIVIVNGNLPPCTPLPWAQCSSFKFRSHFIPLAFSRCQRAGLCRLFLCLGARIRRERRRQQICKYRSAFFCYVFRCLSLDSCSSHSRLFSRNFTLFLYLNVYFWHNFYFCIGIFALPAVGRVVFLWYDCVAALRGFATF